MLRQANRLRRTSDFSRTRNRGRSWATPIVVLHVCPTATADLRAGFSVSKKVGNAVVRNRVKRFMQESVRGRLDQVKPGHDLILTARPSAASATHGQIRHAVEELLRRSKLLQEPTRHA